MYVCLFLVGDFSFVFYSILKPHFFAISLTLWSKRHYKKNLTLIDHPLPLTSASMGAWKCKFPPFRNLWQTDQPNDQPSNWPKKPINQHTDMKVHREVSLLPSRYFFEGGGAKKSFLFYFCYALSQKVFFKHFICIKNFPIYLTSVCWLNGPSVGLP